MRLASGMLADAAVVADGKLYVHGGGWDSVATPALPATHPIVAVALVLEILWTETHVEHTLRVELLDDDEKALPVSAAGTFRSASSPLGVKGAPILQPLALQFPQVPLPREGRYHFLVTVDEKPIGRLGFGVTKAGLPAAMSPPQPSSTDD